MRTVSPRESGVALHRSVAACLAAILEIDAADVPVPEDQHPEPWTVWRNWLAQRGLGLVPIAEPAGFNWPGPWLAVLRTADGRQRIGAVAFGAPPGLAWNPLGGPEAFDAVELGFAVAPADVALWAPVGRAAPSTAGTVEAVLIAPEAEAPMVQVQQAAARAGRGLDGDRYFEQHGTFSNRYGRGHDLTLIEAEALDTLDGLAPDDARRNIVTRGIDLNALVGTRFTIGDVECFGQRLCEPCAHLDRLTRPGTLRALIHKGGLRADIVTDGKIRAGDQISVLLAAQDRPHRERDGAEDQQQAEEHEAGRVV